MKYLRGNRFLASAPLLVVTLFIGASSSSAPQALAYTDREPANNVAPPIDSSEPQVRTDDETAIARPDPVVETSILPKRQPHAGVTTNLFSGHSWYRPPPPVEAAPVQTAPVVRTPTAPPLPFSYIGRYEQEGAGTLYYIVKGDRVYDVKVGDVIDGTYSVDRVVNGQLIFTYLPLHSSQGLRLGD